MAAAGSGAGTSTRGGGGSSAASRWFFSREQLENTPSRRCGVEADKELSYRQQAANLIQDMGQRLNVYPSGGGRAGREGPGRAGARGGRYPPLPAGRASSHACGNRRALPAAGGRARGCGGRRGRALSFVGAASPGSERRVRVRPRSGARL